MRYTSDSVEKAIHELSKLPGVGKKSAQRFVFYLLKQSKTDVEELANSLIDIKEKVQYCTVCFNIAESDVCPICISEKRQKTSICVVEEPNDVLAFEKTSLYQGQYHVLGGVLSPLDGVGPNDLKITELLGRLNDDVEEIIIATNPSTEGEATAIYLSKLINPFGVKVTRIARGIPVGTELEYADEVTLARALEGRAAY